MATTDKSRATHTLTIRVPRKLHERLCTLAERESETHSTVIRRLIRQGLDREQREAAVAGR
jgi:predicted transcriptional regulator